MSQSAGNPATSPAEASPEQGPEAPVDERPRSRAERAPYRALYSLPVEVVVCVGTARPALSELLNMGRDAVITLDHRIDDPVDIRVGDRVIARGELQEMEDGSGRLGVRLTELVGYEGEFCA